MKFAARVLKPGRCIVIYADKEKIPSIIDQARKGELKFQWPIVTKRKESFGLAFLYGRSGDYQLMLVFSKGWMESHKKKIPDLIESDKDIGDRDLVDANHIINYFSNENEIVCDPFLYSGAIAASAQQLGRKIVGFSIDKERYNSTIKDVAFFQNLQKIKRLDNLHSQPKSAA